MTQKIVIFTLCITALWTILLRFLPSGINTSQGQWNSNLIKAETYLYEQPEQPVISAITGSSLAARLRKSMLSANTVNLALGGLSAYDGLLLITSKKVYPQNIYIEINTLFTGVSLEFQSELFSPIKSKLQPILPIFLTKNQPLAVLKGILHKRTDPKKNEVIKKQSIESIEGISPSILNQIIQEYSLLPPDTLINNGLLELERIVHFMEVKKVKVVFFELPVHPSVSVSPLACLIRTELHKRFPVEKYKYIQQPPCNDYTTTDGIHLTAFSAEKYTAYFNQHTN